MSRVLIGQAYALRLDPKLRDAQQPMAPLGALYAAACVREHGHEVALFDAMLATRADEWDEAVDRVHPEVAVLFEDNFNYLSKMCLHRVREAALAMVAVARRHGARVLVAGSDATDRPAPYLDAGADAVILGEGERTLAEALVAMECEGTAGLGSVAGLALHDTARRVVKTEPRAPLRALEALPLPAWDLVDVARYRDLWRARHGYFSMSLVSTRGCPYHCNWCAKPIWGQRYAVRRAESVAAEVAWLAEVYGPDHLSFADDIFGLQPGWIEEYAAALERRRVHVPYKCLSRVDLLSPPAIGALARSGCETVWVGAESGSQRILDAMEKGTRVEQIREVARRLHEARIEVGFFLQFGYPGEALADVEKTLDLVRACEPDDVGISVSYPLPGTKFHERVRDQLGAKRNWIDSADLDPLYRAPFSTDFYRAVYALVHKQQRASGRGPRRRVLRPAWRRFASRIFNTATLPLARARVRRLARAPLPAPPQVSPELTPDEAAIPSRELALQ